MWSFLSARSSFSLAAASATRSSFFCSSNSFMRSLVLSLKIRYYLNPAFDILKLVHFFAEVKDDLDMAQDGYVSPIEYFMVVYPEDLEVARMYPDVNEAKGVNIRVYRSA